MEPVGGPDAVELPAQAFEVVLAQTVAVTRRLRGVVHGAVGFDGQDEAPRLGGVLGCEVDPVTRGADLALEGEAGCRQLVPHVALEGVELDARPSARSEVGAT